MLAEGELCEPIGYREVKKNGLEIAEAQNFAHIKVLYYWQITAFGFMRGVCAMRPGILDWCTFK